MNFTLKNKSSGVLTLYVVLAIPLLILLYFILSYLALNLFLGLDLSIFGRLAPGGWPGYALLGLGLGAAAGAVTAQRRFRLSKGILGGAGALVLALGASGLVSNAARFAAPVLAVEAPFYVRGKGQGQCPACTTVKASSTKSDAANRYVAKKLLDKDPTTAWISEDAPDQTLTLTLTIPADQRLVGLRLSNGYGKSAATYSSFSRVHTCRVSLNNGPDANWSIPDTRSRDLFIPLTSPAGTTASLSFRIDDTYEGENHTQVALSGLTPVIEAVSH